MIAVSKSRNIDLDALARSLGMRRFTARSVILSVLLGSHPPRLAVATLIEFCRLFGIPAGTVRTALSRMAAAGELLLDDASYQVTGDLLVRQRQQDLGRALPTAAWDGTWWTAVVLADSRSTAERRRFRSAMSGAKMGELRPDVWMRPANVDPPDAADDLLVSRGPLTPTRSTALAAQLWDLDALAARSEQMVEAIEAIPDDGSGSLAPAFITLAACLQFLRTEPQLPAELADPTPGEGLRTSYAEAERQFQTRLGEFLRGR